MAAGNSFFGYARGFEIRDSETIMDIIKCSLSEYYTKSLNHGVPFLPQIIEFFLLFQNILPL